MIKKDIVKSDGKNVGARVLAFDNLLFKNDIDTPLSVTIKPATVIRRYEYLSSHLVFFPDCIDLRFDHKRISHLRGEEKYISRGHFTEGIDVLENKGGK